MGIGDPFNILIRLVNSVQIVRMEQQVSQTSDLKVQQKNIKRNTNMKQQKSMFNTVVLILSFILIVCLFAIQYLSHLQFQSIQKQSIQQYQELQFLWSKLLCKDIVIVSKNQLTKPGQISISDIKSWVKSKHSDAYSLLIQQQAIHKCAIIQTSDMSPDFVAYKGFEYIVLQANSQDPIIEQIQNQIISRKLQDLVKISWETANSNSYAIIQFYHPVLPNSKGYYNGNQQNRIKKEHGYFIQNWNDKLIEFYKRENATSIVDLGCGLCTYAMNIKEAGFEVDGYDGNPYTPQLTKGFAKTIDLTEAQRLPKKYDWVQSFEVGEHIPKDKTIIFVENIVRHATKGVLLSWAVIGQEGFYHINNKSNKEVIQMMKGYGFEYDPVVSNQFRSLNLKDAQYFQKSFMAFRKN